MKCIVCSSEKLRSVHESRGVKALACAGCGLIFLHPLPDTGALSVAYGDDYFKVNYLPADRLKLKKEFYDGQLERAERRARPGRLLDVGCGVGTFMEVAAARGWDVRGVDIAEFAVETARKTFGEKVRREAMTGETFGETDFDLITFWDTLEHMPDPVSVLAAARGKLRDGGLLVIKVPNMTEWLFAAARVLKRFGISAERPLLHVPSHLFHFSPASIRRLLAETGFEALDITFLNERRIQNKEHYHPVMNTLKKAFFSVLHFMNYRESMIVHVKKQ